MLPEVLAVPGRVVLFAIVQGLFTVGTRPESLVRVLVGGRGICVSTLHRSAWGRIVHYNWGALFSTVHSESDCYGIDFFGSSGGAAAHAVWCTVRVTFS